MPLKFNHPAPVHGANNLPGVVSKFPASVGLAVLLCFCLWGAAGTIVWGASEATYNNTQCNGPKSLVRRHSLLSA